MNFSNLNKFKKRLDPRLYNGAIFIGLDSPVVKSHGGTDFIGFSNSLEVCSKIVKGIMDVGQVAPEPTGGTEEISSYKGAYKSSIAWLSAFATKDLDRGDGTYLTGKGPKEFRAASWGKIGNIGGQQILPTAEQTISVGAGQFDSILLTWKTGGQQSKVWIVDEFPFPIKAKTFMHVSQGIPPVEYEFELLDLSLIHI